MPKITFIDATGTERVVEAEAGRSVMEAARLNGVPGILAMCCGFCACATCHVYVDEAWLAACPPMDEVENAMLDIVTSPRQSGSRLSCQLIAFPALDGIVLHVPD